MITLNKFLLTVFGIVLVLIFGYIYYDVSTSSKIYHEINQKRIITIEKYLLNTLLDTRLIVSDFKNSHPDNYDHIRTSHFINDLYIFSEKHKSLYIGENIDTDYKIIPNNQLTVQLKNNTPELVFQYQEYESAREVPGLVFHIIATFDLKNIISRINNIYDIKVVMTFGLPNNEYFFFIDSLMFSLSKPLSVNYTKYLIILIMYFLTTFIVFYIVYINISCIKKGSDTPFFGIFRETIDYINYARKYEIIFNGIKIPIVVKNNKGEYIECNDAFLKLSKLTKQSIIGKKSFEIFPSERSINYHDDDISFKPVNELRLYSFGNSTYNVSYSRSHVPFNNELISISTLFDLSTLGQTETLSTVVSNLLTHTNTVIIRWRYVNDDELKIDYISDNFAMNYGYEKISSGDIINFKKIIHPDDFNQYTVKFSKLILTQNKTAEFTYRIKNMNTDEYVWIKEIMSVYRDKFNEPVFIDSVLINIDDVKSESDDYIEYFNRFKSDLFEKDRLITELHSTIYSVLNVLSSGIVIFDDKFNIIFYNTFLRNIFGENSDLKLLFEDEMNNIKNLSEYNIHVLHNNNEYIFNVRPIKISFINTSQTICLIVDITRMIKAEVELNLIKSLV
jgi:PAS domain-containing protein